LEWKLVYVGSAEDEKHDQVLDCVMVGPVVQGKFKFVFQVRTPNNLPQGSVCCIYQRSFVMGFVLLERLVSRLLGVA
jgi:hypothetical protein